MSEVAGGFGAGGDDGDGRDAPTVASGQAMAGDGGSPGSVELDGIVERSDVPNGAPTSDGKRSSSTVAVVAVLATLAVVVLGASVAYLATKPSGHELTGSITVLDEDFLGRSPGGSCNPSGGYSDIDSGSQVTVEDGAGTTFAVGTLGQGTYIDVLAGLDDSTTTAKSRSSATSDLTIIGCRLAVSVADVPDADFYRIQIGRRDPFEIARADLAADGWTIELSVGDPL